MEGLQSKRTKAAEQTATQMTKQTINIAGMTAV
jgi:hypothetical protein